MFSLHVLLLALSLLVVGADAVGETAASPATPADSWRQTRDGWQRTEEFLSPPVEYRRPSLHPGVVGSLEVLLTLTAMLAFSKETSRRPEKSPALAKS